MASEERNALAELAERLETHIVPIAGCVGSSATGRAIADDIRTAQRIIDELSKVGYYECLDGLIRANTDEINAAFRKILAIAEEGNCDGK